MVPLALATVVVIAGGLFVTFFANVPLNDELAGVDLRAGPEALAQARADDEDPWNTWTAVRTVACAAALASLVWALRLPADRSAAGQRSARCRHAALA